MGTTYSSRRKLRILWLPHNSWGVGRYQRDQYFIDRLCCHHTLHVATWSDFLPHRITTFINPAAYLHSLRSHKYTQGGYTVHHLPRLPGVLAALSQSRLGPDALNRKLFIRAVERIIREEKIDLIVSAQSLGRGRFLCPFIFDYVDSCGFLSRSDQKCLEEADRVLCVSERLMAKVIPHNRKAHLLPNGADLKKMRIGTGERVREKYRLGSDRVVSLIGLTFSQDLYFLEAIEIARRRLPNLKCLLVGKSELLERALVRFKGPENGLVYTGPVPYSEIQDYFAASDVGLYPGDDSEFFQAASPIKIFEYTAARKYVVSSRLEEMEKLGWGNLVFAEPSGNSFAEGILTALKLMESRQFPATTVAEYDWDTLTRKLEELLQESQG